MSFVLRHQVASAQFRPTRRTSGAETFFTASKEAQFAVLYPGPLGAHAMATFTHRFRVDVPEGPHSGHPTHGGYETATIIFPLELKIFTPDGSQFTATEVTLADLRKYRDLRGAPSGLWTYKASGESAHFQLGDEDDNSISNAWATVGIIVEETVRSESASPLVNNAHVTADARIFAFDLFRTGDFVAEISLGAFQVWLGSMRLLDPDGVVVAHTSGRTLHFPVVLRTLDKSRDTAGRVRKWTLEVSPLGVGSQLSATVIGSARINTAVLKSRIDKMIGTMPPGNFINLYGENKNGEALARLEITDTVAIETLDMHGLLDRPLSWARQDPGIDPNDLKAYTVYTLARVSDTWNGIKFEVGTLKVGTIEIEIGPGAPDRLGAAIPAVRLSIQVTGSAKAKLGPATLATAKVRGGVLEMEVGLKINPDGTPQMVTWVPDSPFDMDTHWDVIGTFTVLGGPLAGVGTVAAGEYVESYFNDLIASGAREFFDPSLAPRILMMMLGAHLTYKSPRFEGDDIVFDHIAPLEPDPAPRPGYAGVIGRSIIDLGPGLTKIEPPTLGDTWAADNLSKIEHIVVVMMENRSYDHVLGYRAQGNPGDGADGLTDAVIDKIEIPKPPGDPGAFSEFESTYNVRKLREADFPENSLHLKTRIPKGVGHSLGDVTEQLGGRTPGPDNRQINSPKGFVDNFLPRLSGPLGPEGMIGDDVLGYYDAQDLPFFDYLADNYAYCDSYYCSHPGPTLPNRMYSLTGDVQYDRLGVPILNNNHGDNFLLSRAMTIYDLLSRKGIGWRVYQSDPSVTMLRMFARYATNNTEIVSIDRLQADVTAGNLPEFTVIEPRMHSHPEDDDHPPADMHRGQNFLKERVYDTLRSNPTLWEKTMLIITYDEHGGLYDHVVPPIADVLEAPSGLVSDTDPSELPPPALPVTLRIPYGVRVPTFIVSPWTMRGKSPSLTLDHCSILKTVLARFAPTDKPFLGDRVNASHSFNALLTEAEARMDVPPAEPLGHLSITEHFVAPAGSQIVTPPLSRKAMRDGPVDYHELTGRLARMLGR